MKRVLFALSFCALVTGASPAFAAETNTVSASPNEGVIVCRVAKTGEIANARMMVANTTLICKPIDSHVSVRMIGKVKTKSVTQMGPVLSAALTPAQMDAAWHAYLNSLFNIVPNLP